MTVLMEVGRRLLPWREQYPLPPRQITEVLACKTGVDDDLTTQEKQVATAFAHFGYGAAMGALYGGVVRPVVSTSTLGEKNHLAGVGWGLAVWTGSYLGLLPALGILSPATRHPARRNALMIAAHVVWGVALEEFYSRHASSPSTAGLSCRNEEHSRRHSSLANRRGTT